MGNRSHQDKIPFYNSPSNLLIIKSLYMRPSTHKYSCSTFCKTEQKTFLGPFLSLQLWPILSILLHSQTSSISCLYSLLMPHHSLLTVQLTSFLLLSTPLHWKKSVLLKYSMMLKLVVIVQPLFYWTSQQYSSQSISSSSKQCLTFLLVLWLLLLSLFCGLLFSYVFLHASLSLGSVVTWPTDFIHYHGLNYHLDADYSQIYHCISNFSSHFQISIVFLLTGHKTLNIIQVLKSEHVKIWINGVCTHTLIHHSTCVFHLSKWQRNRYLWKLENWYMVSSWTLYFPFPVLKCSLHSMNSSF